MPIYEFYCSDCHTVFNFLSRRPRARKRPSCPRCGRPRLERRASAFAVSTGRAAPDDGESPPGADPRKLERALAGLAAEAERGAEDDPRAVADLMRRFCESGGLPPGDGMSEALRRLAAGEDPERIETELGELLEAEEAPGVATRRSARRLRPRVDPELHEL